MAARKKANAKKRTKKTAVRRGAPEGHRPGSKYSQALKMFPTIVKKGRQHAIAQMETRLEVSRATASHWYHLLTQETGLTPPASTDARLSKETAKELRAKENKPRARRKKTAKKAAESNASA